MSHALYVVVLTALLTGAARGVLLAGTGSRGKKYRGLRRRDVSIYYLQETD